MDSLDHDVFEGAVHAIAERAANTNKVIDGAMEVSGADYPVMVAAKVVLRCTKNAVPLLPRYTRCGRPSLNAS